MTRSLAPLPLPIEQAARDATVWWPGDKMMRDEDRWPYWLCLLIWLALLVPVWAGGMTTVWWLLW
jgi:hypothetical protein